jgi:hypothetical protein
MSESKELDVYQNSPVDNATRFLKEGGKPEQLREMMDLQERWEANEARKAFHDSMTEAQKHMPVIPKDKQNKQTNSMYSKHETIVKLAKPVYTDAGFSLMFYEGETQKENHIRVMCDIRHEKGHLESRFIDLPLDLTGIKGSVNKTGIHGAGSTFSYGRRYLTCMIFNIPTGDDNDGNQGDKKPEETELTPKSQNWEFAKKSYMAEKSLKVVLSKSKVSEENQALLIYQCAREVFENHGDFSTMQDFEGFTEEIRNQIIDEKR